MNRFLMRLESLEVRRFLSATPVGALDGSDVAPTGVAAPIIVISTKTPVTTTPATTDGGRSFSEYAKQKFTAKLGEFTEKVTDLSLNAVVYWGDGSHSTGKLVGSYATGEYYVQGTHTYSKTGTFQVDVKIFAKPVGSPITPTSPIDEFKSVIKSKTLKPTDGGLTVHEVSGEKFSTELGEFTYKTVDQLLNAVIDWGDGKTSDGKLVGSYATGEYYVTGSHTYSKTGTYKVDVKIYGHLPGSTTQPTSSLREFISVFDVNSAAT